MTDNVAPIRSPPNNIGRDAGNSSFDIACQREARNSFGDDAVLIERVFCNLLENAVKYAPQGEIVIAAAEEVRLQMPADNCLACAHQRFRVRALGAQANVHLAGAGTIGQIQAGGG